MEKKFLVIHDYQTGGLWRFVYARSREEILEKFQDLEVIDEIPAWMNEQEMARIKISDIDDASDEFLKRFLRA